MKLNQAYAKYELCLASTLFAALPDYEPKRGCPEVVSGLRCGAGGVDPHDRQERAHGIPEADGIYLIEPRLHVSPHSVTSLFFLYRLDGQLLGSRHKITSMHP